MIACEKEFREIVANKDALLRSTEKVLENIVDDITLGIIFDVHRQYKTGAYSLIERDSMVSSYAIKEDVTPHFDIFGQYNQKQNHACTCPKCSRSVAAQRFAPHLAECMGSGRLRSRKGGRMNLINSSNCNGGATEVQSDDDDVDWSSAEKRRKKKHRNGKQKGKRKTEGTPKKNATPDSDVCYEAIDYEAIHRIIMEDLMKSKASTESAAVNSTSSSSTTSSSKRRDKSKSKKSRRDRTGSPLNNLD